MALKPVHSSKPGDDHGGNCDAARAHFPSAPEPWIDLSTGVNPHSYPHLALPDKALSKLPSPNRLNVLKTAAASTYRVHDPARIVASPGTQPVLAAIMSMIAPGRAIILGPTYFEHARCAALAGHNIKETAEPGALADADIAVVVNPNNPDGRLISREDLLDLAGKLANRDGLLLVDEAFMDIVPDGFSLTGDVSQSNIIVLKSFGKFFGLPGLRLSFAIGSQAFADHLSTAVGPWPVSALALETGINALNDVDWQVSMREHLSDKGQRLAGLLQSAGLELIGGTNLFQLVGDDNAKALFEHLGASGILVRRFTDRPHLLRFGLPGDEGSWLRLEDTLTLWKSNSPT